MRKSILCCWVLLPLISPVLFGNQKTEDQKAPHSTKRTDNSKGAAVPRQTVIVTGSWDPVPLEEVDRSVNAYSLRNSFLLFGSLADGLALDSSVQVQGRAPNGVQGDLSIRGGNFEQTLVLLNGFA